MKVSRHGGYGILEPNPNKPRNRSERPRKTHTRADQSDGVVQSPVSEVVERLGEGKLTHDIETEPAKVFIGKNRLRSVFRNDSLEKVCISFDLNLV